MIVTNSEYDLQCTDTCNQEVQLHNFLMSCEIDQIVGSLGDLFLGSMFFILLKRNKEQVIYVRMKELQANCKRRIQKRSVEIKDVMTQ